MSIRLELIQEIETLHSFVESWQALADDAGISPLFRGPRWLLSWWRAYQRQLGAELYTLAIFDEQEDSKKLVGLAPFYRRSAKRSPARKIDEIRLIGDAGPRPPAFGILAEPGFEEKVGTIIANYLADNADTWDVLDLQPLEDPSQTRAHMVSRLASRGRPMDSSSAGSVLRIELNTEEPSEEEEASVDERALAYIGDAAHLRKGLATLRRISRLEWSHRDEASPFTDRQATHLLEDVVLPLGKDNRARLARFNDQDSEAVAAALVVDDGDRAVVLALAVDPESTYASARLLEVEVRAARQRGCKSLDICVGSDEPELPALPVTRKKSVHLCVYGTSSAASLARTYGKVRRKMHAAKDAPGAAAAGARAAWSRIRTAASHVAGVERLHLYRGELWTRGVPATEDLHLQMFEESDFDTLKESDKDQFLEGLHCDEVQIRAIWEGGDIAVLARLHGRPAGIVWCACQRVMAPEVDRFLEIGPGEAYIHDLFVAPAARGRGLAASILEFLAIELRTRDIYKSWALIASDNAASIRAFEKAAYAAVADIVHAHIAGVDKLVVRPPDMEAKKLLGM